MTKVGSSKLLIFLATPLIMLALAACGGNSDTSSEVLPATATDAAPSPVLPEASADSQTQEPAGTALEAPSGTALDEYLFAACGGQEVSTEWETGESIRDISTGLGQLIAAFESLAPPPEVSDWHDSMLAFQRAFKGELDGYLEDPQGQSEDEFLLSSFLTLGVQYQPVERAIAAMDPELRSRMIAAGCIDEETTGTLVPDGAGDQAEDQDVDEIAVGGSVSGTLSDPEQTDTYAFKALADESYLIEMSWDSLPSIEFEISDWQTFSRTLNPKDPPFQLTQIVEEDATYYLSVSSPGTGTYMLSVVLEIPIVSPSNAQYVAEGPAIRVSWDPVEGADYYNVYHDNFFGDACWVSQEGEPSFCSELATNLTDPAFLHESPDRNSNHYWVAACNSQRCSEIDSGNPARPAEN